MKFNSTVFEKLLFPLNKRVYRQIQETINTIDEKHPGKLQEILTNFEIAAASDTQTPVWKPGNAENTLYPSLDISILYEPLDKPKIQTLHKDIEYRMAFDYKKKPLVKFKGSHLVVRYFYGKVQNCFIVPLEYLLGFNENSVLKDGSYQLYSHTILSLDNQAMVYEKLRAINNYSKLSYLLKFHQTHSLIYIGITKRTWQERYRQHYRDMNRGSNLLFHRALRGEFCQIGIIEHIVERAGLTINQALKIEEKEVEKRSLHSLYPGGLNMIPGGKAGLKFVHQFINRTGYTLDKELSPDTLEAILVDVQRHTLKKNFKTTDMVRVNHEI